jgi:hypothetical protein
MPVCSACALNILRNCMLHCLIAIGCVYIPQYTVHDIVKATLPWLCTVELRLHNLGLHGQWREITDRNGRTDVLWCPVIINRPVDVTPYGSNTPWRHSQAQCFNFSDSSTALCVVCAAVIGGGENRTLDRGSWKGQEGTAYWGVCWIE